MKWTGAAVSALLLVTWVGSRWWQIAWHDKIGTGWSIWAGEWRFHVRHPGGHAFTPGPRFYGTWSAPFRWSLYTMDDREEWQLVIPLWIVVGPAILVTAAAWLFDTLARRRAHLNLCPTCHYDRTGLPPQSPCPECASPP